MSGLASVPVALASASASAPVSVSTPGSVAVSAALAVPGHRAAAPAPIPHWLVLFLVVPALWIVIGGLVAALDRLLGRLGPE